MIDWTTFNVAWMPFSRWHFGTTPNAYGDVVIWLGRLYVSWNWRGWERRWEWPQ